MRFFRGTFWLISLLVLVLVWVNLPAPKDLPDKFEILGGQDKWMEMVIGRFPIKLGLDLQGGTEVVLEADVSGIELGLRDTALESAREVIEKRVNLFGVSEALVQTSRLGEQRRIRVELPGVHDTEAAVKLIGQTAKLEFRELVASPSAALGTGPSAGSTTLTTGPSAEATAAALISLASTQPTGITGADLKKAQVTFGQAEGGRSGPQVGIEFGGEGARKFAEVTKRNVGKPLAIFLDDLPISAPAVQQEIIGGNAVITGSFTTLEAKNLTIQLNAGALPVPVKIIHRQTIGATLGTASMDKSLVAGLVGLGMVVFYMIGFYGWLGFLASTVLLIYTLVVLAIFRTGFFIFPPITLTLAGIAGFILSIGMAVDANILIFERMKEEVRSGKDRSLALEAGFKRAWPSIRDSNVSSLITSAILFYFGTSVVKGFALTLTIGVLVSMFSALIISRSLLKLLLGKRNG